jgi:hypothetical protein
MKVKEMLPLLFLSLILLPLVVMGTAGSTLVVPPWNHCLGLHKVRQFHLDIFSGYRNTFNDPQGLFCTKLLCKDNPDSPSDDDELSVFGLNSGAHELIYNKSLTSIGIIGGLGRGDRQFNRPRALTGDREGNIFVADTGNDRIVHLVYRDDDLAAAGTFRGARAGSLRAPSGICLSGGLLYVADTGNDRIVVMTTEGEIVEIFKPRLEAGRLTRPYSIAVVSEGDPWLYYRDYFLAVVDSSGRRLWKIDHAGNAEAVARYADLGRDGAFNHVAVDYYGNIYATDSADNVVHKFDRHLNYITAVGEREGGDSQFDEPRGIALYRRFGQVFISERSGAQYYWVGTDILRFSAGNLDIDTRRGRLSVEVSFLLTEHSAVSIRLEDDAGKYSVPFLEDHLLPCGVFRRRLEIQRKDAAALAKCTFTIVAAAKPTYSSGAFLSVRREVPVRTPTVNGVTPSARVR